ncbi:hypothetical protein KO494_07325 [Lacinutrix sp. C3R15]|uniref:hypothetical protein n=1 Tax=Flavobacteriaceae TaxID=49546 RepID=UPI001C08AB80|nr:MULTISPECIES: hypothetical protein [Flavobacteriaceae]MBU2939347.1 hypothetical protein [Lacinutrix sp. C3R15]MDO6622662.1 hypothetical protein [Oceanihabitans sp. 1_MG-2023]
MLSPKVYLKSCAIVVLLCIFSCASNKQVIAESPETISTSQILFLNYVLVKNDQDEKSITLINKINTEGILKGKPENIQNPEVEDLEYSILDKDFNELEKGALKNPLKKTVEFVNDFGNFEKRVLDLDSVQFNIRLQLPAKAKYIVITELTNTESIQHITTKIE